MDEFFNAFLNQDYAGAERAYEAFAAYARRNPQEWLTWCNGVEYNQDRWQADPMKSLIYHTIMQIYSLLNTSENPDNQQLISAISNLLGGSFQYLNGTPESQYPESRLLILKIIVDMFFSCLNDSATVIRWNAYLYNMIVSWNRKNGDDVRAFFGTEAENLIVKRSYEDIEEKWTVNELNKQKIADLCDQKAYVRLFRNQLLQLNMNMASQQSPSQTFSSQATGRQAVPVTEMKDAVQYSQPQSVQPQSQQSEQRSPQRLQQNQPDNYPNPQKNYENHEESNEEEEKESPKSPKILMGILTGLCVLFLAVAVGEFFYVINVNTTIKELQSSNNELTSKVDDLTSALDEANVALDEYEKAAAEEVSETTEAPSEQTSEGTTSENGSISLVDDSFTPLIDGIPVYAEAKLDAERLDVLTNGTSYTINEPDQTNPLPENWYSIQFNDITGYLYLYKATEAIGIYSNPDDSTKIADQALIVGHYYSISNSTEYEEWMNIIYEDGTSVWIKK